MPSLSNTPSRHVILDRRTGQYLSFPDAALARNGNLVAVYREADGHVAGRARLLWMTSRDLGATWSAPRELNAAFGHCPRVSRLANDDLVVIDDGSPTLYVSRDNGKSFAAKPFAGAIMPLPDRLMELAPGKLLTAGHSHRGSFPHPKTRQPTSEEMAYLSEDGGASFIPLSVMAYDPCLVLCEASMARLPDGRILALLRENSFVYEPMYAVVSRDDGATWSDPMPTPLIGHRPCLGQTADGRLLVTYRDVGPNRGTAAWLGDEAELSSGFAVAGLTPAPDNPRLTDAGMVIENEAGKHACARFALRPLTDPERASAVLTAKVKVDAAEENGCGIRFGGRWWRLFPDRIEVAGRRPIAWEPGRFHDLRLTYNRGLVTLNVDGARRTRLEVDARSAEARPVVFGTVSPEEQNGGRHTWRSLTLSTREPRYERRYDWQWDSRDGRPDAWNRSRVLELKNDRFASFGDFGYSGWVELPDGRFFCVYHHGGGDEAGYEVNKTSHVRGTWFTTADFAA